MATVKTPKKKKMSRRDKVMVTVSIIMIVTAVLALAVVALMNTSLLEDPNIGEGGMTASYSTDKEIRHKTVNFLLCGIDSDADNKKRGTSLSDVIMVANYDMDKKAVNILQVPRDTYVGDRYPTGSTRKINAIYNRPPKQTSKEGLKGGLNGLIVAINEMFQVPIDHYVTISMDGFRDVVDALGGLEVYSEYSFTSVDGYKIQKGTHKMSGQIAEAFVRERKHVPGGDAGRQKNQRAFLSALMDRLLNASVSELAKTLPSLLSMVKTDMTAAEMLDYAKAAQGLQKSNIVFHSLAGKYGSYRGQSIFSINKAKAAELLNQYFRPYSDSVPAEKLMIQQVFDEITVSDDAQAMDQTGAKNSNRK